MEGGSRPREPRSDARRDRPTARSLARAAGALLTVRYLLDTTTLSEPLRPRPDPSVLRRLAERSSECATAALVVHELRYGAMLLDPSKRRQAIEAYVDDVVLATYPVLPYDVQAAQWHARERARLDRDGEPQPFGDALVAAIAASKGLVLVTDNVRHFRAYQGLVVESWH